MKLPLVLIKAYINNGFAMGLDHGTSPSRMELISLPYQLDLTDKEYVINIGKTIGRINRISDLNTVANASFTTDLKCAMKEIIAYRRSNIMKNQEILGIS